MLYFFCCSFFIMLIGKIFVFIDIKKLDDDVLVVVDDINQMIDFLVMDD